MTTYLALQEIPIEDLRVLLDFLTDASAAVIVMNLKSEASYKLISHLPKKKQHKVIQILIDLESAEENILDKVLTKVENEILKVLTSRYNQINTKEKLSDLICRSTTAQRVSILEVIKEKKKSYFNQLHRKLIEYKEKHGIYFFEDILNFSDTDIRKHINKIEIKTIAMAIKNSAEAIQNKLLENMSSRVREMVMDDLKHIETITQEEIEEAQNEVVVTLMQKE